MELKMSANISAADCTSNVLMENLSTELVIPHNTECIDTNCLENKFDNSSVSKSVRNLNCLHCPKCHSLILRQGIGVYCKMKVSCKLLFESLYYKFSLK